MAKKPNYKLDFGEDPAQWRLGREKAEANRARFEARRKSPKKGRR